MVAKRLSVALALLCFLPPAALALGLGDIRLLSSLNAPLDAEIELISATPEELSNLKATIATRDTFARYGLEYPAYLNSVTLTPTKSADGRDIIKVRSSETMTEPFLTMLVQVDFARGILVREYTMLLDPPVFAPGRNQLANAPVAEPATESATRAGGIDRPADPALAQNNAFPQNEPEAELPPLPPPPAPAPSPSVAAAPSSRTYEVQRGDSLSAIARRLSDPTAINQWMVAAYQGNPAAFGGNMSELRAGAVLRVPDRTTVQTISAGEAASEVRRQYAAWRSSEPTRVANADGSDPARLRLVTPTEPGTASGTDRSSSAEVGSLRDRVQDLQAQVADQRRLLELKDAELARLQTRLGDQPVDSAPVEAPPAPPSEPESSLPVDEEPVEQVAAVEPAPPATEPAPTPRRTPAEEAADEGSLLDTLTSKWWLFAAVAALALGYFGFRSYRSRQQAEFDDSLGRLASVGASSLGREPSFDSPQMRAPAGLRDDFLDEDEDELAAERPRFVEGSTGAPATPTRNVPTDETISSETAINLDQGDPLAEADFHMAYGLYDQAADLVRIAIQREPGRRDLQLKLLEVYFVWGNREQFLEAARELKSSRDGAAPGEWEKIVIMGKQLAPDDPLFSGGDAVSGAAASGVDLDLEGGQSRVDFDLLGDPVPQDGDVDLDIGTALGSEPEPATDRNIALDESTFASDDGAVGTTREMAATIPGDSPLSTGTFGFDNMEAPTVEQPGLQANAGDNPTIRQKVEMALKQGATEHTAELAIDDLGLDLGALDTMDQPGLGSSPDAPTMVAGLDERSRRIIETAEQQGSFAQGNGAGDGWQLNDPDEALPDLGDFGSDDDSGSDTSRLAALKAGGDVDFDIGNASESEHSHAMANGHDVDLDVGTATMPDAAFASTQRLSSDDLALPDLEPVTMSEVGTKLDLARAYMDMGDPEGARNILEEVMQEGSMTQKQEAQRLIESLPG